MQITPLKFVLVGFGNAVCANRIVALARPDSAAGRRTVKQAKDHNTYTDMTFGRSLKSLLLLDDGAVIGCGLTGKTILARLGAMNAPLMEDEQEHAEENDPEDHDESDQHLESDESQELEATTND